MAIATPEPATPVRKRLVRRALPGRSQALRRAFRTRSRLAASGRRAIPGVT
jgi:hypothetical protein